MMDEFHQSKATTWCYQVAIWELHPGHSLPEATPAALEDGSEIRQTHQLVP